MRRKRIAIIAGGILVLVVASLLAAVAFIDVNGYRAQVASLLANRLNREITLGRLSLSLLPLGLRVENAVIGEARAFQTGRPFARMRDLYVSPSLMPLLRGTFELRSVELRQPEIELVRNAAGQWNFATLGGSEKETSQESALVLNRLVVNGGQVAVTDLQRSRASNASGKSSADGRTVYRNIDVQIDDFAPKKAFGIMLAATLPGDGAQRLSIRGRVGPVVPDDVTMTPFEGTAQFD
jgi:AsmA protein